MTQKEKDCLIYTQMLILKEVRRICEKYNLRVFLTAGSMLGAVRHQGYIPWDDDMDVGLPVEDYEKFLEVAPQELGPQFYLDNHATNSETSLVFTKIRLLGTVYSEEKSNPNAEHQEIFVDVFPYYYLANQHWQRRIEGFIMLFASRMLQCKGSYKPWKGEGISKWLKNLVFEFSALFFTEKCICSIIDHFYRKHKRTHYMGIHSGADYLHSVYPAHVFEEFIEASFEGETFLIPKEYDLYLSTAYGKDYMALPPEEKRGTRHPLLKLDFGPYIHEA